MKFDNLGNIKRMYYNIRIDNEGTPNFSEGNIHYIFDEIYQHGDREEALASRRLRRRISRWR